MCNLCFCRIYTADVLTHPPGQNNRHFADKSHCLNQRWSDSLTYAALGGDEINQTINHVWSRLKISKKLSYQYRNSHFRAKRVALSSYPYKGNPQVCNNVVYTEIGPCSPLQSILLYKVHYTQDLHSLSGKTSYRKFSWSPEAAIFGFILFRLLWHFNRHMGNSAAVMPVKYQSDTIVATSNLAAYRLHEIWR